MANNRQKDKRLLNCGVMFPETCLGGGMQFHICGFGSQPVVHNCHEHLRQGWGNGYASIVLRERSIALTLVKWNNLSGFPGSWWGSRYCTFIQESSKTTYSCRAQEFEELRGELAVPTTLSSLVLML
jgi:hypothetical protein